MNTLKEQLLKAGLVSKKDAKRAGHERRVEAAQVGREEMERRAQAEREAAARQGEENRRRDQQEAAARLAAQQEREQSLHAAERAAARIEAAFRDGRVEHWEGSRAYYFVAEGTRIEFLGVSDDTARRLAEGKLAIVRTGDSRAPYTVLLAGPALRLREAAPDRVVVCHDSPPASKAGAPSHLP
jgi:uncharacterized protein YaiL (DUF2058 family)